MSPETEAYLSEALEPTGVPFAETRQAALAFLDLTARLDAQVATWMRRLQAAELTEDAAAIRAHFEEHNQTLRALQREIRETESRLRDSAAVLRQYGVIVQRMQGAAAPEGEA